MRDYDVRIALREKLRADHEGEPGTLIIEELGLHQGKVRADLAVINGSIHGFEIKSDRDTLERLPRQRDAYAEYFDVVTLVVGPKHLDRAMETIPDWWGVILASAKDGTINLKSVRMAQPNSTVRPEAIVELLWRDEALACLAAIRGERGLKSKSRQALWRELAASVDLNQLRLIVRETIKARGDWRVEMRQARCNDSSPIGATAEDLQANLDWLLSLESPNLPD